MAMPTVPDWLRLRDGSLKPGVRDQIVYVMISDRPDYRLDVRPAGGTFTCAVTQTVNGRRFDDATTYPTADAALAGGLDQLRAKLGW